MKHLLLLVILIFSSCIVAKKQRLSDEAQIINSLFAQQSEWNSSDIDKFMETYHKSDSLKFIGRSGVSYGWETVLTNYKKTYPTPERMGKLKFEIIHLDRLGRKAYRLIGSYQLEFQGKENPQKGYYTLIWEKKDGVWLITSDHTSG